MQTLNKFLFYLSVLVLFFFSYKDGTQGLFFAAILFASFAHLLVHNVIYAFILCAIVVVNPNGMLSIDAFGLTFHFLRLRDIFFYCSFLFAFLPYYKDIPIGKELKRLLPYFIIFTFYQIFVSLMIKLGITEPGKFVKLIEYFKLWLFGIYLIIPTYKIIRLDSELFIKTVVHVALLFAVMALISVYTPYQILYYDTETRYTEGGQMRMMLHNAELLKLSIFIAIALYFMKYANKLIFFVAGVLTLTIPFIGMFRLEIAYTMATILLTIYFVTRNYNANIFKFFNLIFILIGVFMVFLLAFPDFANSLIASFVATFNEFSGDAPAGATQTRTIIELPNQLALIRFNPILGVGFQPDWWMNYRNNLDWGLSDIPFTATIAMYGAVGMVIYYSRFYKILSDFFKTSSLVKRQTEKFDSLDLAVFFGLGAYFVTMISFRFFYVSWELTIYNLQAEFGIFLGIFYGLIDKFVEATKPEDSSMEPSIL